MAAESGCEDWRGGAEQEVINDQFFGCEVHGIEAREEEIQDLLLHQQVLLEHGDRKVDNHLVRLHPDGQLSIEQLVQNDQKLPNDRCLPLLEGGLLLAIRLVE